MTQSISDSQTVATANPLVQIVDPERYRQFIDKCSRCYSDSKIWNGLIQLALGEPVPDLGTLNAPIESPGVKARWIVAIVASVNPQIRKQYRDTLQSEAVEAEIDFEAICNEIELDKSLLAFGGQSDFDESHDCLEKGKALMRYVDSILDSDRCLNGCEETKGNEDTSNRKMCNPNPDEIKLRPTGCVMSTPRKERHLTRFAI